MKTSFKKGDTSWNKGIKGRQVAWNKGLKGIQISSRKGLRNLPKATEETKLKMSESQKLRWKKLKKIGE